MSIATSTVSQPASPATHCRANYGQGTTVFQPTPILPLPLTLHHATASAYTIRRPDPAQGGLRRPWLPYLVDGRAGFITHQQYDLPSGAVVQRIDDVDTGVVSGAPSGWTTPTGGGLNLVTDYEIDDRGRQTEELGPTHTIDLGGMATVVRSATWTVRKDGEHEVWVGRGYATGTSPSYTYTLINPDSITRRDADGNVLEEIAAVRSSTSGRLQPSDSFPQSSYVRWTTHQYTDCCLLSATRVYHAIPASGEGTEGTNYEFDFRNRQTVTDGEIDYYATVEYDNLNRIVKRERYDTDAEGNLISNF